MIIRYECQWVKVTLPTKVLAIDIFYRPPNTNVGQFLANLEDMLIDLHTKFYDLVCFGAFNFYIRY